MVVASAMGKTTNALLHASTLALETGEVDISAIRTDLLRVLLNVVQCDS